VLNNAKISDLKFNFGSLIFLLSPILQYYFLHFQIIVPSNTKPTLRLPTITNNIIIGFHLRCAGVAAVTGIWRMPSLIVALEVVYAVSVVHAWLAIPTTPNMFYICSNIILLILILEETNPTKPKPKYSRST